MRTQDYRRESRKDMYGRGETAMFGAADAKGAPGYRIIFEIPGGKIATPALQRLVVSGPGESHVAELLDQEIHSPVPSAKRQRSASTSGLRHDLPSWFCKY